MKTLILVLICLCSIPLNAQQTNETHSTVAISPEDFKVLVSDGTHGLPLDHFHKNEQQLLEFVLSESEIQQLIDRGVSFQVIIEDYENHFLQSLLQDGQQRSADCGLANFDEGNMGGYHTFDQMVTHINAMQDQFPELVKVMEIGQSIENRPMYAVKISDNVMTDESADEGVAYFDALTHAREPMSLEATLYYMWWLLENYTTDPEAAYLVDHRELYFVPVANPDGYVYNQTTNPSGGGLWRKNRRDSGNNCFGVDLNRNYSYGWGLDSGSSNIPCSNTYRGEAPFSEPETQAIRDFLVLIQPAIAFTNHTYGDKFLSPWGYVDTLASYELYSEFASEFIPETYDGYGTTSSMLAYTSSGTTRDYLHSEGILAWTPEIGHSFWEPPSVICERVIEFLEPMKYLSWVCGDYACFQDFTLKNDQIWKGDTIAFDIRLKNRGLTKFAPNVVVTVNSAHPALSLINNTEDYGNLGPRQYAESFDAPFRFEVIADLMLGEVIPVDVEVYQNDALSYQKTIYLRAGKENILYQTDFESDNAWFDPALDWDTTALDAMSGFYSFTDSPLDNYSPNSFITLEMDQVFDLSEAVHPIVSFNAKWSLEPLFDEVSFLVSTNGVSWVPLPGWHSNASLKYNQNSHWVQEFIDLSSYSGEPEVYFAFRLESDNSVHSDGFYIDDFKVSDYTEPEEIVAIDDLSSNFGLLSCELVPNPGSMESRLKINSSEVLQVSIIINDMSGKVWMQQKAALLEGRNSIPIEIASLSAGVYNVQILVNNGLEQLKLVVVK